MEYINLTPHEVVLYSSDREVILAVPKSGEIARVVDRDGAQRTSDCGPVPYAVEPPIAGRRIDGLPAPKTGVAYLCSVLCLDAARALGRFDVVAPDTDAGAVRDESGRLIGTTRFLLAGDPEPAYRCKFGSVTYSDAPSDYDLLGYGDAVAPFVDVQPEAPPTLPLDYHVMRPVRGHEGEWVIRVPVYGPEDLSSPVLLWHSPVARPVRVERQWIQSGPAQLRRYAATGIQPAAWLTNVSLTANAGELAPVYRGSGLLAWRSAARRLSADQWAALPAHVAALTAALIRRSPDALTAIALKAGQAIDRGSDVLAHGAQAASGEVEYQWSVCNEPERHDADGVLRTDAPVPFMAWRAPYAVSYYRTPEEFLTAWEQS